jgi:hypothetical protein
MDAMTEPVLAPWMRSPIVKLVFYVLLAIMPAIVADLAAERVSWLSAALVVSNALVAAKAYISDPRAS